MAKSALKFKDSVAAYEKLAQEIAARRFAPVYLLMGEESYFIDAIAERLATTDVVTPAFTQQATKHDADAQRQHPMQPVPAHAVGKSA